MSTKENGVSPAPQKEDEKARPLHKLFVSGRSSVRATGCGAASASGARCLGEGDLCPAVAIHTSHLSLRLPPTSRLSKRGIDSGRVAVSLAESTVFRKFAKPVTIPAKLWLTLKFVQGLGGMGKGGEGGDDADDGSGSSGRKSAKSAGGKRRRQLQQPPADAGATPGRGRAGAERRADTIVTERERGWWERGPAPTGGRGIRSAASSSSKAGWGLGRSGRRRKAICPPGTRGGGPPGCFVPTTAPGRCFVPALPASSLPRRRGGSIEARLG